MVIQLIKNKSKYATFYNSLSRNYKLKMFLTIIIIVLSTIDYLLSIGLLISHFNVL
ncbi:hypothetical protein BN1326_50118 [Staphylococcus argenteus]|uniref:Uncharacterized protein n=1 Tax=Staphylococcus argenteus TaxID=985002 RepID=A0A7U7PXU3_9STAP|nr:hypothetical protein BN1326_50118 [Staphylococcus argenteus]CRI23282.1 hypothetical protein BN1326_50118 [Staphylococcus argenteus]